MTRPADASSARMTEFEAKAQAYRHVWRGYATALTELLQGLPVEVRWREKPSAPTYDKYDPFEVNVEWDSWLRRTRDAPPTRGEIEELDIYRKVVAERAAALDRAHAKKKLEAEDARAAENAEAPPQDRLGSGVLQIPPAWPA